MPQQETIETLRAICTLADVDVVNVSLVNHYGWAIVTAGTVYFAFDVVRIYYASEREALEAAVRLLFEECPRLKVRTTR